MSKIRLTKEFRFEMAHALYGYDGPCKNIHGHSYCLHVTVIGKPIQDPGATKNGMLMDFTDLKAIVQQQIIEPLDHALMLNGGSPHKDLVNASLDQQRLVLVDFQPTCENMLIYFAQLITPHLPHGVTLHNMLLRETPTSYAEWFAADQY